MSHDHLHLVSELSTLLHLDLYQFARTSSPQIPQPISIRRRSHPLHQLNPLLEILTLQHSDFVCHRVPGWLPRRASQQCCLSSHQRS